MDELEKLLEQTGYSRLKDILVAILTFIKNAVGLPKLITSLNETTRAKIKNIKDKASTHINARFMNLKPFMLAKQAIKDVNDAMVAMKNDTGLLDTDFKKIIRSNAFMSVSFVIVAGLIMAIDYFIGGALVFRNNQSIQTAMMLLASTAMGTYFYYLSAERFAVTHRLRAEVAKANRKFSSCTDSTQKDRYRQNPKQLIAKWADSSNNYFSHDEGITYWDPKAEKWCLERSNKKSWYWIIIGTLFNIVRLVPVIAKPSLYGKNALLIQLLILVIAVFVSAVVILIELYRRKDTGLPESLQEQINDLLHKRNKAQRFLWWRKKTEQREFAVIENLKKQTNDFLEAAETDYKGKIDTLVSNNDVLAQKHAEYKEEYDKSKNGREEFLGHLPAGYTRDHFESETPDPESVLKAYPPTDMKNFKVEEFTIKHEEFEFVYEPPKEEHVKETEPKAKV